EGIERRHDLETLIELGVEFGQGFLLGRPALEPAPPRRLPRRVVATLSGTGGPDHDERLAALTASTRPR
ncbi:MAG: EAL domain-containing protein, partial [Chloroflexi bacterium]